MPMPNWPASKPRPLKTVPGDHFLAFAQADNILPAAIARTLFSPDFGAGTYAFFIDPTSGRVG